MYVFVYFKRWTQKMYVKCIMQNIYFVINMLQSKYYTILNNLKLFKKVINLQKIIIFRFILCNENILVI